MNEMREIPSAVFFSYPTLEYVVRGVEAARASKV
jgi:hypothetical protein